MNTTPTTTGTKRITQNPFIPPSLTVNNNTTTSKTMTSNKYKSNMSI